MHRRSRPEWLHVERPADPDLHGPALARHPPARTLHPLPADERSATSALPVVSASAAAHHPIAARVADPPHSGVTSNRPTATPNRQALHAPPATNAASAGTASVVHATLSAGESGSGTGQWRRAARTRQGI